MIFAAGFGTRMGTLTANRPKPLIEVAGKPLLDHALEIAAGYGTHRVVVNTHYHAAQIERHLANRPVQISHEPDRILETGGGLRNAMPLLGSSPVITLNSDAVWTGENPLNELASRWDNSRMDALLLLSPVTKAIGYRGNGDFLIDEQGRLTRANGAHGYVYLGAQIIRTDALPSIEQEAFSLNLLWDRMIAAGRVFGVLHQGQWCDVGRPEGIEEAETMLGARHV